jgi:hypothetical protein
MTFRFFASRDEEAAEAGLTTLLKMALTRGNTGRNELMKKSWPPLPHGRGSAKTNTGRNELMKNGSRTRGPDADEESAPPRKATQAGMPVLHR